MSYSSKRFSNYSVAELERFFDKDGILYSAQSLFVIDELKRLYIKERGGQPGHCSICGSVIATGLVNGEKYTGCSRTDLHIGGTDDQR